MLDITIFCAYLLLLLLAAWWKGKAQDSNSGFLLGNKATGLAALTATLVMAELNMSTLLGFSSMGYIAGMKALLLPFAFLIGLLFYSLTAAKPWQRLNALSVSDLFHQKYGSFLGATASVFLFLAMLGFGATYIKSLTVIFQPLLPQFPSYVLSICLSASVLLLCIRSGLLSVIRVDGVSFIAALIFIPILFYFSARDIPSLIPSSLSYAPENLPTPYAFSIILLTTFTYIASPWYGQRIFSARSPRIASTAVLLAALIVFVLYGAMVLAAAYLRQQGAALNEPEMSIPYLVQYHLPDGLRGWGYGLFFALAATTLSGLWTAMTAMLRSEFERFQTSVFSNRQLLFFIALLSWILAELLVDSILRKLILANIPVYALSFSILAGFHWSIVSRWGATISTFVGLLWGIACYIYFGEEGFYTLYWAFGGLPLIFGSGIVGSLVFPDARADIE
jgi:Na+/proline symporter